MICWEGQNLGFLVDGGLSGVDGTQSTIRAAPLHLMRFDGFNHQFSISSADGDLPKGGINTSDIITPRSVFVY